MRSILTLLALLVVAAAVDVLRSRRTVDVALTAHPARRNSAGHAAVRTIARNTPPSTADVFTSLRALCPSITLPGRRVVITATAPHVALVVHPAGEQISDALVTGGEWDGWGGAFLVDVIKNKTAALSPPPPSLTILDAGANIGALAVRWAATGFTVDAFEATAANADLLACSAALNGDRVAARVSLFRAALTHVHGDTVCMAPVAANMGMSSIQGAAHGAVDDAAHGAVDAAAQGTVDAAAHGAVDAAALGAATPTNALLCVPTTTVDAHVAAHPASFANRFALLKIDVEGYEPALLAGAQHVLASPTLAPLVVSIEVSVPRWAARFNATAADVLSLITRHGYRAVFPPDAVGGMAELAAFAERERGGNPDIVFVKQGL